MEWAVLAYSEVITTSGAQNFRFSESVTIGLLPNDLRINTNFWWTLLLGWSDWKRKKKEREAKYFKKPSHTRFQIMYTSRISLAAIVRVYGRFECEENED